MGEVRPRVTGTEMEWSVGLRRLQNSYFDPAGEISLERLEKLINKEFDSYRTYMENGARCYKDQDCLEYATGEDDSFWGTVANEIAGEQLVYEGVEQFVAETAWFADFILPKRVFHGDQKSAGYHMNFCADATKIQLDEESLYDLGLWAATVSMYTGAGCLYRPDLMSPLRFAIAQKPLIVRTGFNLATTDRNKKPLICLRDEPHADKKRFQRIQVVGLDPNIAPWASWMQLGTASLCLRAIEQGIKGKRPLTLHSLGANDEPLARLANAVAQNTRLDTITRLDDGSTISAIDIQGELYQRALQTEHTDEEAQVLKHWEKTLGTLATSRAYILDKAGWPKRHEMLRKVAEKHGFDVNSAEMMDRDRKWDEIKEKGIPELLRSKLWAEYYDTELIHDRRDNPCPNTRAKLRSDAIKLGRSKYAVWGVRWDSYQLGSHGPMVELNDPLMTTLPDAKVISIIDRYSEEQFSEEDIA